MDFTVAILTALAPKLASDGRSAEELREHYEIEKVLATRLRNSTKQQRHHLYADVYNELFQRVDHHPLVAAKRDTRARNQTVTDTIHFLKRFLTEQNTFLEIGPGDCALVFEVAKIARTVYGVDVSSEIMQQAHCPSNCTLLLSDGCSIPVPGASIDVAYSKDVLEHLHPDDAYEQLVNIHRTLVPGGIYICRTPNALSGPHDVSRFFDDKFPTGLHLKEYTTTELGRLFRSAGFSKVHSYVWGKGMLLMVPLLPVVFTECILSHLPRRISRSLACRFPLKRVLSRVVATK